MAIFSTYPVKTPPAGADQIMIADSADGGACKLVAISDLIIAAAENVLYVMVDDTLAADDPDNLRFKTFNAAVTEVNTNYSTYPTIVVLIGGAGPYSWTIDFAVANPRISLVKIADVSNQTVIYSGGTMSDFPFDLLTVDLQITVPGAALVTLHVTDSRSYSTISFDGDAVDTIQIHELYGQYFQIVGDLGAVDVRVIGFDNDVVVGNLIVSNFGFVDLGVFADGALATTRSTNIEHFDTAAIDVLRINSQNAVIKESIISAGLLVFGGADLDSVTRGIRNTTMNIRHTITKIDRDTCTAPNILDAYAAEYPYATYGLITFDGMQNCNINFESIDFSGVTAPTAFAFKSIFSQRNALAKAPYIDNSEIRIGRLSGLGTLTAANFTGFSATPTIWDNDSSTVYTDGTIIRSELFINLSTAIDISTFAETVFNTDIFPGDINILNLLSKNSKIVIPVVGVKIDNNPTTTKIFGPGDATTGLLDTDVKINIICYKDSDGAGARTGTLDIVDATYMSGITIIVDYIKGSLIAPVAANTYSIKLNSELSSTKLSTYIIKQFYTTGSKEIFTFDMSGSIASNTEFYFPKPIGILTYMNLFENAGNSVTVHGGNFDIVDVSTYRSNYYDLVVNTGLTINGIVMGDYNNFYVSSCAAVTFDSTTNENKIYGPVSGSITDTDGLGILGSGNVVVDDVLKQATIVRNLFLAGQ